MFIKLQAINPYKGNELKSTRERLDRQEKRDNQIAFYEQQKENLKGMRAETLEEISRKLNLLHGYDDQIALAKKEYNNSQMMHVMDEAVERGEKIAEEAEKYAPKTPEERKEEMIEEATGVEKNEGMLSEIMDEMTDAAEEMPETEKELEAITEELLPNEKMALEAEDYEKQIMENSLFEKYRKIDYRV